MNYYEKKLIWDDVKLIALTFHDATKHRFNINDYKNKIIKAAIDKFTKKDDQINYIIENTVNEILPRILKYNRRFLILTIMQVKELSYTSKNDTIVRQNIQDLTNLLLMIISNNYDKFSERYKSIGRTKKSLKELLKDIEWTIELGYLIIYATTNQDYLFDCIDDYNISDIIKELIYPPTYEEFHDNDYLKMDNKKKPEEYIIKNEALKDYIDSERKATKCFETELDCIFEKQYGFNMSSLKILGKQSEILNTYKTISIRDYSNNLKKEFVIQDAEKIFEFLNCNKQKNMIYDKNSIHSMELHPVFIDDKEIIYSQSHLTYTLTVLVNLIRSGDTQFAKYYNFPKKEFGQIQSHINTYMESYMLGALIELVHEKGYIVPKINYNNSMIPVADVKKIKEFGLNNIDFDSDLFFADPKRKIIYNIDFKYSNSPVSLKLTWMKGENRIPDFIDNLRKRQNVIENNLQKVKEILKIDNISEFSFKSALCMVRSNYYCYVNSNQWNDVYYTNWFKLIENLNNGNEILI